MCKINKNIMNINAKEKCSFFFLNKIFQLPLIFKKAENWENPAWLEAVQIYFPVCWAVTKSIESKLVFFPILEVIMPNVSKLWLLSKCQEIFKGWSPSVTKHDTCTDCPANIGESPKEKGNILGWTANKQYFYFLTHFLFCFCFYISEGRKLLW